MDQEFKFNFDNVGLMPQSVNTPHLACILLLDTSGSMSGRMDILNKGIARFLENVVKDEITRNTVDLAIIEFNSKVRVVQDFAPICKVKPPKLNCEGLTSLGEAMLKAIDMVNAKRNQYAQLGISAYKPMILVCSDGCPTDVHKMREAKALLDKHKEKHNGQRKFHVYTFFVGDNLKEVNPQTRTENPAYYLSMLSTKRGIIHLNDETFDGFFDWLSKSMQVVSNSQVGFDAKLPSLECEAVKVVNAKDLNDWMFDDIE